MVATNLRKQVGTLVEWFPLVGLVTALGDARPGVPRTLAALQILRFVAAKTAIKQDDELLMLLEGVVLTEQGKALVDYVSEQIAALMEPANADK